MPQFIKAIVSGMAVITAIITAVEETAKFRNKSRESGGTWKELGRERREFGKTFASIFKK